MLPSHIFSAAAAIPVVPHLCHHARLPLSLPLTLSAISIILNLQCACIVILPHLCCGPYRIIFHSFVYFAAVVCLPSPIEYSPCSTSFYTTLLSPLWSTLLLSLSALIFSLHFYFLFWHGSMLSPWYPCSAPICRVFSPLALTPLWSNLIIPISSFWYDLLAPSLICSTTIAPLMI